MEANEPYVDNMPTTTTPPLWHTSWDEFHRIMAEHEQKQREAARKASPTDCREELTWDMVDTWEKFNVVFASTPGRLPGLGELCAGTPSTQDSHDHSEEPSQDAPCFPPSEPDGGNEPQDPEETVGSERNAPETGSLSDCSVVSQPRESSAPPSPLLGTGSRPELGVAEGGERFTTSIVLASGRVGSSSIPCEFSPLLCEPESESSYATEIEDEESYSTSGLLSHEELADVILDPENKITQRGISRILEAVKRGCQDPTTMPKSFNSLQCVYRKSIGSFQVHELCHCKAGSMSLLYCRVCFDSV